MTGSPLAAFLLIGIVLMGVCVCGGWRLSCAERKVALSTASIHPDGEKRRTNSLMSHSTAFSFVGGGGSSTGGGQSLLLCGVQRPQSVGSAQQNERQQQAVPTREPNMLRWVSRGDKNKTKYSQGGGHNDNADVERGDRGAFEGGWTEQQRAAVGLLSTDEPDGGGERPTIGGKSSEACTWLSLSSPPLYLDAMSAAIQRENRQSVEYPEEEHFVNPIFSGRSPGDVGSLFSNEDDDRGGAAVGIVTESQGPGQGDTVEEASEVGDGGGREERIDHGTAKKRTSPVKKVLLSQSAEVHAMAEEGVRNMPRLGGTDGGLNLAAAVAASGSGGASIEGATAGGGDEITSGGLNQNPITATSNVHLKPFGRFKYFKSNRGDEKSNQMVHAVPPLPAPANGTRAAISRLVSYHSRSRSGSVESERLASVGTVAAAAATASIFRTTDSPSTTSSSEQSASARPRLLDRLLPSKQPSARGRRQWTLDSIGSSSRAAAAGGSHSNRWIRGRVGGTVLSESWSTSFSSAEGRGGLKETRSRRIMGNWVGRSTDRFAADAEGRGGGGSGKIRNDGIVSGGILSRSSSLGYNTNGGLVRSSSVGPSSSISRSASFGRSCSSVGGGSQSGMSSVSSTGQPPMLPPLRQAQPWPMCEDEEGNSFVGYLHDTSRGDNSDSGLSSAEAGAENMELSCNVDGGTNDAAAAAKPTVGSWQSAMPTWWQRYRVSDSWGVGCVGVGRNGTMASGTYSDDEVSYSEGREWAGVRSCVTGHSVHRLSSLASRIVPSGISLLHWAHVFLQYTLCSPVTHESAAAFSQAQIIRLNHNIM